MKLFKVKADTRARLMNGAGYRPYTTRKETLFEREEVVLDPVIFHNRRDEWARDWPQLDALDQCLFEQHVVEGDMIFCRDGHFLAVPRSMVEVLA